MSPIFLHVQLRLLAAHFRFSIAFNPSLIPRPSDMIVKRLFCSSLFEGGEGLVVVVLHPDEKTSMSWYP